jgi:hypothetical protein
MTINGLAPNPYYFGADETQAIVASALAGDDFAHINSDMLGFSFGKVFKSVKKAANVAHVVAKSPMVRWGSKGLALAFPPVGVPVAAGVEVAARVQLNAKKGNKAALKIVKNTAANAKKGDANAQRALAAMAMAANARKGAASSAQIAGLSKELAKTKARLDKVHKDWAGRKAQAVALQKEVRELKKKISAGGKCSTKEVEQLKARVEKVKADWRGRKVQAIKLQKQVKDLQSQLGQAKTSHGFKKLARGQRRVTFRVEPTGQVVREA